MLDKNQPIIVKKIKKGGHGHHGGAWKIAYADFVTAMMAFFLLMWLLAMSTPEQRMAISEYFQHPTATTSGSAGTSSTLIDFGNTIDFKTSGMGRSADYSHPGPNQEQPPSEQDIEKKAEELEQKKLEELKSEIEKAIESNASLQPFKDQLKLEMTEDGLRIEVMDKQNRPMFDLGSAQLQWYMKEILHELAKSLNGVPNQIGIAGHTDARQYSTQKGYSNWELSSDRANASRRELIVGGLNPDKISRVVGMASTSLQDATDPNNPINRRISITALKKRTSDAIRRGSEGISERPMANIFTLPPILPDSPGASNLGERRDMSK